MCYDIVNGCMDTLAFNYNDYDYDGYPNELTGVNGLDVNTHTIVIIMVVWNPMPLIMIHLPI